ncbi:MAG: methyltransferase domain-containing protein [Alphaproteobacteria bacterium]|nr:methyltransferase domain-containing protein [Alphaproteobacteria bacterium]
MAEAVTEDRLLGGRLTLRQPAAGLRVGIDAVFLAAAVPAAPGERVLDLGAGVGAAGLCLAARVGGLQVLGLELQRALVTLANDNAAANDLARAVQVMSGDLRSPPPRLAPGSFHHVMANPPYAALGTTSPPANAGRRTAAVEVAGGLADWLRCALLMARAGGSITVVQRAERLDEVILHLRPGAGGLTVFPLWPRAGDGAGGGPAAKLVLVQGRKGSAAPFRVTPGLVLHGDGDGFTAAAEAILRHAAALQIPGE